MSQITTPSITAFLTSQGIDLILRNGEKQTRSRIAYEYMRGTLDGGTIDIEVGETDDERITIIAKDKRIVLKLQPKGHFFGWIDPIDKAEPISLSSARVLMQKALAKKAKRA